MKMNRIIVLVALAALVAGSVVANERLGIPDNPNTKAFGVEAQNTALSAYAFVPQNDYYSTIGYGSGYRWVNGIGGTSRLRADLGAGSTLPQGALLDSACLYTSDTTSTGQLSLDVIRYEQSATVGQPSAYEYLGVQDNTGMAWASGYQALCVFPDHTITTWDDVNGDGYEGRVTYVMQASLTGGEGNSLQVGNISLNWSRQISPAPGSATFDDVPTGHPFFQHIEALVDSDITAGCGGDDFCPNDPVTRGQMAVFLAKALGLHWAN